MFSGTANFGIKVAFARRTRAGSALRALAGACLLVLTVACDAKREDAPAQPDTSTPSATAVEVMDDAGLTVRLDRPAQRIISLIPSATETLIAIGAAPQIAGRTRYDVAVEVASLPSVGGGVDPSIEAIVALKPDLVVGWESDKRQQVRPKLAALKIPMFLLRTQDTTDVFRGMKNLGVLTGHVDSSARASAALRRTLDSVHTSVASLKRPKVFYVVFNDPPMTAGPHTFIGQLIGLAGGESIFSDATANWPNVAMEEIVRRDPDIIVVPVGEFKGNSLERFRAMRGWRTLRAVREGNVRTVPANLLSRPSPNIGNAAGMLRNAFFPQFPTPVPTRVDSLGRGAW